MREDEHGHAKRGFVSPPAVCAGVVLPGAVSTAKLIGRRLRLKAGRGHSSAIASRFVTVVQLRAVAVTPNPRPANRAHSRECAIPSGCQA
jgi:hypothetical protein